MNSVTQQFQRAFNKLDIYGVGFNLRYNQNQVFQSNFGAFITIIIGFLILVQLFFSSRDLIEKRNPEVIQSEIYQPNAEIFEMKQDTFNFSVGVQYPGNFTHFIDNSVYEIFVQQVSMVKQYNNTSRQFEQIWNRKEIPMSACKSSNFGLNDTREYFNSLANIKQMYCVADENNTIFIQGNYDQDSYGLIRIEFRMCQGKPYCKTPEEINEILNHSYVAIYMSDVIVNPSELNPYKHIGKDIFWNNSPQITRDIDIYYRNIAMESDEGMLFEEMKTLKATQFSYQSEAIIFDENSYFFAMQLRFEKQKATHYQRKFKKLDRLLAEIGGIAKALIMIGFIITFPLNKLKLNEKLMNQLFTFQTDSIQAPNYINKDEDKPHNIDRKRILVPKSEIDDGYSQKDEKKSQQFLGMKKNTINNKLQQYSVEIIDNQKKEEFSQGIQELKAQISNSKSPNDLTATNLYGFWQEKSSHTNNLQENKIQRKSFGGNKQQGQCVDSQQYLTNLCAQGKIKLTWIQYIRYYLWPWGNFSKVKQHIEDITSQVYSHLDIIQIVKTQLEFEKIKSLLFDEDQIKLLEYLPKPKIDLNCFLGQKQNLQQENFTFENKNKTITSIYYKKRISEQQEQQEALVSLNNIINKKAHSIIDLKLIKMLEQNIQKNIINENSQFNQQSKEQAFNFNSINMHQKEPFYKIEEVTPQSAQQLNSEQLNQSCKLKKVMQTFNVSHPKTNSKTNGENNNYFKERLQGNNFILKQTRDQNQNNSNQNNESISLNSGSCILDFQYPDKKDSLFQDGQPNKIPKYLHNFGILSKNQSLNQI